MEIKNNFTSEEEIEIKEIKLKITNTCAIFFAINLAILALALFIICNCIYTNSTTGTIFFTVFFGILLLISITANICIVCHYRKFLKEAKHNDQIRKDERIRFKERERLEAEKQKNSLNNKEQ